MWSAHPPATVRPSGESAHVKIEPAEGLMINCGRAYSLSSSSRQMRTVPSRDAETILRPSSDTSQAVASLLWPSNHRLTYWAFTEVIDRRLSHEAASTRSLPSSSLTPPTDSLWVWSIASK